MTFSSTAFTYMNKLQNNIVVSHKIFNFTQTKWNNILFFFPFFFLHFLNNLATAQLTESKPSNQFETIKFTQKKKKKIRNHKTLVPNTNTITKRTHYNYLRMCAYVDKSKGSEQFTVGGLRGTCRAQAPSSSLWTW